MDLVTFLKDDRQTVIIIYSPVAQYVISYVTFQPVSYEIRIKEINSNHDNPLGFMELNAIMTSLKNLVKHFVI